MATDDPQEELWKNSGNLSIVIKLLQPIKLGNFAYNLQYTQQRREVPGQGMVNINQQIMIFLFQSHLLPKASESLCICI